jgi:hypothetical protein
MASKKKPEVKLGNVSVSEKDVIKDDGVSQVKKSMTVTEMFQKSRAVVNDVTKIFSK